MEIIKLDADESMLLLLTKNWKHKEVNSTHSAGSLAYIQDCCNHRYATNKAYLFSIYLPICEKVLRKSQFISILSQIESDVNFCKKPLTPTSLEIIIFSGLSCTPIQDRFELDTSLVYQS